ncbi:hypothetical protein [Sporosarcina sp. HYO08]|uniref:hypothetical protein n=1 Tax=Sporosarcina sp. HYO08 TaxID=1759557 RepID=UPI0007992AD6|nr:hypothetical protein [Sporosarcina sp. HYO08]KXH82066.1 hypothetical protein AU377_07390 [Sporosarcina sp. HYO08]
MVRSLPIVHLFIILAVGYIGGALLFREMPVAAIEKLLAFYDVRVMSDAEKTIFQPLLTTILLVVIVIVLASFQRTRLLVLFLGALKCVLFGLSSSYLLSSSKRMIEYTIWWFPFQFLSCFLFLMFCAILVPPYFMRTNFRKKQSSKTLFVFIFLMAIVLVLDIILFLFVFQS